MTKIITYVWKHWVTLLSKKARLRQKKLAAIEESNDDAEMEASKRYVRQQREKKKIFLDELEAEAENFDCFDAFTEEPRPNDIVLFAMPMCAPYRSLTKV
ncbi:putative NFACT protein [Plasmopara halstedii]